jgi:hypothetical protein
MPHPFDKRFRVMPALRLLTLGIDRAKEGSF